MYRYVYFGYNRKNDVKVRTCAEIYYSVVGYYKNRTFVYFETKQKNLDPESVVEGGDFVSFPDGKKFMRMEQIFYCDDFTDDSVLVIPLEERRPFLSIMELDHDLPVLAYIAHHYLLQQDGKTVWNRYYSIYELGNTLIAFGDLQEIPVPERESVFAVSVDQVVDTTRPLIDDNRLSHPDGTVGWQRINK